MKRTALVLAAHGSRVDPRTNQTLVDLADRVRARHLFDEVAVAFHQGSPTFAKVLDTLSSHEVVVVPVMTSAGYYCDRVLPSELAKNRRFIGLSLFQTPPVGAHLGMVEVVASRARALAAAYELDPECTTLGVVGHGTLRNPQSRTATEVLADSLASDGAWGQVLGAFLDEEPGVETILQRAAGANVVVIPFMISSGPHVSVDIPTRLGLDPSAIPMLPASIVCDDRMLVIDQPIGVDPGIEEIIIELARRGHASFRTQSASDGSGCSGDQDPALALGVLNVAIEVAR